MLGGLQSVFVREIRLWRRFEVVSSIETWQGLQVVGQHRFVLENGETAALVLTTAGVYDRPQRRFVPVDEVLGELGQAGVARPLSATESAFLASHSGLRALARNSSAK